MNQEAPNLKNILKFLHDKAMAKKADPMTSIVEFMNSDPMVQIQETILESMNIVEYPDFTEYFMSTDGIEQLYELRKTDEIKYYNVVNYQNIFMGIATKILDLPYVIVLTPDNLAKTYYIKVKYKTSGE